MALILPQSKRQTSPQTASKVSQSQNCTPNNIEEFGFSAAYDTLHLYSGLDGDQLLQLLVPGLRSPSERVS